jgi:hypothetical protein
MKDRKEVRQLGRDLKYPKEPLGFQEIFVKLQNDVPLTRKEDLVWDSYYHKVKSYESFCSDLVFLDLVRQNVVPVMSWDTDKHNVENELSKFNHLYHYPETRPVDITSNVNHDVYPNPGLKLYQKECRKNSMKVCINSGGRYRYVEGLVIRSGSDTQRPYKFCHSWNVDSEGQFHDFTLNESVLGWNPHEGGSCLYLGIEIPNEVVFRVWDLTKFAPPIIPFLSITPKNDEMSGQCNG